MSGREPNRDRYGRYKLPDPTTGAERSFTRVTTLAKCLADTTALDRWKQRMVAKGLTERPDLADVVAMTNIDDRETLDAVCAAALEAAGAGDGARTGTRLHHLTEQVDLGLMRLTDVPAEHVDDVRAYVYALGDAGIEILPDHIERIIVNQALDVAGTYDRLVRLADGRYVIADLKTAKNLTHGQGDIAIQLAIYANADNLWNWGTYSWEPMPGDLDRTTGLVMHLPVGKGTCTLHEVDLTAGWEAASWAQVVRRWRGRRDLFRGHSPVDLATRIANSKTSTELEDLWRANPTAWTDAHVAQAKARRRVLANLDTR